MRKQLTKKTMQIKIDYEPEGSHQQEACREDIANYLDEVVTWIRKGFTSGAGWELTGKDPHEADDDHE